MKKLFLSLTVLILFSINAKSENKQVSVSIFDVPANEQWMVDRVLSENPDLKAADLSRVEFEAGTYYGQVNSSGVPNGHGILGSADEVDSAGKGIESNFINGKIGKNEEPTIVSSTGETQTGTTAIEFQNRVFNNGFDVRVGLQSTLIDILSKDKVDELQQMKNSIDRRYHPEIEELQNLYMAENIDNELILEKTNALSQKISYNTFDPREEEYIREYEYIENELREAKRALRNSDSFTLGDMILHALIFATSGATEIKEEIENLERKLKDAEAKLREYRMQLFAKRDMVFNFIYVLNFGFLQNPPTDNDEKLAAILLGVAETDLYLDDIRFNINVNLRKDTTTGAIEGMIKGKWYEIEIVTVTGMSGTNIELQLTQKGKRDFDRDKKGEKGTDGSSEGEGEGEGGGMTYLIPNPKSQYLI